MREKNTKKSHYTMRENCLYMLQLAWKHNKSVIFIMLSMAVLAVCISLLELLITPILLQQIELRSSLPILMKWLFFFTSSLIISKGLLAYLNANTLLGRLGLRLRLISEESKKIQQTSYPNIADTRFLEKYEAAMSSTMSNGSATESIWNTISKIIQSILGFAVYLLLLSHLNLWLAFIVIVTSLLSYLYHQKMNRKAQNYRESEEKINKELYYIQQKGEDLSFAKDIRLFNMAKWLKEIYQNTLLNYQDVLSKKEKHYTQANLLDVGMNLLRNGIAYSYLIYLSMVNEWLVSEFLLYFMAISGFSQWIQMILTEFSKLHQESLDISHLRDFLEFEEPFLFEDGKELVPDVEQSYEIYFKNVSFTYPGAKIATFEGINLSFRSGESIAIVGLNGAGKTTLVKLICGFLDPTSGEVLLNGVNIKEFNRRDYYRHFSAVFQNFSVLETTILENITQGVNKPNLEKIEKCIAQAGIKQVIEQLPNGIETHLGKLVYGDGIELSGGQLQRLMLARALYKDSPILVLDEPTAALDPIAENAIYQKYHELSKNRLSIFISHRLASTRFCQRIIYLEKGKVIEEGNHETLLLANGKYKALFDVQRKYYQEEVMLDGNQTIENLA